MGHGESQAEKPVQPKSRWGVLWGRDSLRPSIQGCERRRVWREKKDWTQKEGLLFGCCPEGSQGITTEWTRGRGSYIVSLPEFVAGRGSGTQSVHHTPYLNHHNSALRLLSLLHRPKNWDSGRLGNPPKFKHPAPVPPGSKASVLSPLSYLTAS